MCASATKTSDCRECYVKQMHELAALCGRDDATLERMLAIKDEVLAGLGDGPWAQMNNNAHRLQCAFFPTGIM